ncbi:hypothetical protein QQF64_006921 [Cirrhinus molitorella]|uniref:Secreted protein n=1 Tax=Cirrhinus molitorella TaxID=172907 RepID=A0ABR3MBJ7_9TELE
MFTCHSLSLLHISLCQTSRGKIEETCGSAQDALHHHPQSRASEAFKSRTRSAPDGSPTSKPQTQWLREAYGEASCGIVRLAVRRLEEREEDALGSYTLASVPKLGRASDAQHTHKRT